MTAGQSKTQSEEILSNGWTVLRQEPARQGRVILAHNAENYQPYATWFEGETGLSWGHYHDTLARAELDFDNRAGRGY